MSRQNAQSVDTTALRRQAKRTIDQLSGVPLQFAADFLNYLGQRRPNKATEELLGIPTFTDSLSRGVKDVRAGRVKGWRKVRDDV
jgi:hypothetical protein